MGVMFTNNSPFTSLGPHLVGNGYLVGFENPWLSRHLQHPAPAAKRPRIFFRDERPRGDQPDLRRDVGLLEISPRRLVEKSMKEQLSPFDLF